MGNHQVPGPICSTRVGDDWIDDGTSCRAKSPKPGPVGAVAPNPAKATFDSAHAYSLAPEARRKRAIDLEIIGGDYSKSGDVSIDSETYLKKLIEIGSGGRQKVSASAKELQFFIVRGGGEGFLPDDMRNIDARNNVTHWPTTNGKQGETDFDENDLLAVFDAVGTLIGSARLSRPTYVEGNISKVTARRVYDAWAGKKVFVYRSARPNWIPYLGLGLDDGFRDGSANDGHKVVIDMHKEEDTNGCIFIVDPASKNLSDADLRTFEPTLIKKILASKSLDPAKLGPRAVHLGRMHVVTITL